jgi:diguanylate cyclase (GGDEF)-like protein
VPGISRPRHLRRGLLGGIAALIALAILTGAVLVVTLGSALDRMSTEVEHADELAAQAARLRAAMLDQETGLRGYQLTGSEAFLQPYRLGLRAEQSALDYLLIDSDHDELVLVAREVAEVATAWRTDWVAEQVQLVKTGDFEAVRENVARGTGRRLFDQVRGALGRVDLAVRSVRSEAITALADTRRFVDAVIVGVVAAYGAALVAGAWWTFQRIARPLDALAGTAEALERGESVEFVAERDDEFGTLAVTLERLQRTAQQRCLSAAAIADRSTVFNRLSELVSYAENEDAVVRAGVAALERLLPNRGGEVMLVNPSFDQLRVHSAWGQAETVIGGRLPVDRPTACPGIRRNAVHVTRSALDAFSLTCEVHPLRSGSLICVPMVSHNEVIGVLHVEREQEDAFDDEDARTGSRVAEQVALAMANLRLMRRMEEQAMTDPLTGLANPRAFDPMVERELAIARREGQRVAVIMLDLDHFKQFNDAHGHPAGDEALRAFARTVRGTLRETDVAARYGGEEFAVLLRGTDLARARTVADKLRSAIEVTPIEIGPNRFAKITASLGVAASDAHGTDRMQLMRLADAALYMAKRDGRNRVEVAPVPTLPDVPSDEVAAPTPLHARNKASEPIGRRTRRAAGFDPAK